MRNTVIIVGLALGLGACGKDKIDQAISDLEGWKDKMCACKDKACTDDLEKDYRTWRKEMKSSMSKEEAKNASAEKQKKFMELTLAMDECRMRLAKPDSGDSAGFVLPQEWKEYGEQIAKMEACAKEGGAKKIFSDGYKAKSASWAKMTKVHALLPQSCATDRDNIKKYIEISCKSADEDRDRRRWHRGADRGT